MPSVEVTPEQRSWANRVLGLLGKTPSQNGAPPDLLEESEDSGTESESDRYGEGYKPFKQEARGALKTALDKDPPAKAMISLADWDNLTTSKEAKEERKKALEKAGKHEGLVEKRIELLRPVTEHGNRKAEWRTTYDKLKAATVPPPTKACDLTGVPPLNRVVAVGDVQTTFANAIDERNKALKKRQKAEKKLQPIDTKFQKSLATCLPLLDAPENNPERAEVGALLQAMEDLEQEIATNGGVLSKKLAKKKVEALAALEKKLFEWNDRRTAQNLPPSAEAVALLDLHQTVHQQMVAEVIQHADWDPPIAGYADLTKAERAKVKETWDNLRDDSLESPGTAKGKILIPHAPYNIPATDKDGNVINNSTNTQAEADLFRLETLANFSRLLASQAGRHLVDELNAGGHTVEVAMTREDMACSRLTGVVDTEGLLGNDGKAGTSVGSRVHMPSGKRARASNEAMSTENGNYLNDPPFIGMAHELVHAMHNGRGKNRRELPSPKDEDWDNLEEYRTIFAGKTSEQTMRHQYGLATPRYAHKHIEAKDEVMQSFAESMKASKFLSKDKKRDQIEGDLKAKGLDPAQLTDVKKVQYSVTNVDGAKLLQLGWDPNQLTTTQAVNVVANDLAFADLKALGWAPHELPDRTGVKSIADVVGGKRYHPRSPQGHRFATLGGQAGLDAILDFNGRTGCKLTEGPASDGVKQLKALKEASSWLKRYGAKDPVFKSRVLDAKKKLKDQLAEAATYLEAQRNQQEEDVVQVKGASGKVKTTLTKGSIETYKKEAPGTGSGFDDVVRLLEEMEQAREALAQEEGIVRRLQVESRGRGESGDDGRR